MRAHSHYRAGALTGLLCIPERRRFKSLGTLFSGPPTPPQPPAPTPMPDLQDPAILAAQKLASTAAQARSGRASTILTQGDSYGGTKLGAA